MLRNQNCQNYLMFLPNVQSNERYKGWSGVGYPQILQKHFPQRRGGGCHPILPSFSWKNKHIILLTKTLTSGNFNLFLALFWFILGSIWSILTLFYAKTPFLAVLGEIFLGSKWRTLRKGGEGYSPTFFTHRGWVEVPCWQKKSAKHHLKPSLLGFIHLRTCAGQIR